MSSAEHREKMVLFLGGPLQGTKHAWYDPPDYHPHVTAIGMVPYAKRTDLEVEGADIVYAPIGMARSAVVECLKSLHAIGRPGPSS